MSSSSTIASTASAAFQSLISSSSVDLSAFFVYYLQFKLLLCSLCSVAITAETIKFHLSFHFKKKKEEDILKHFINEIAKLKLLSVDDTLKLLKNTENLRSFKELVLLDDVFQCTACLSICQSLDKIRRHCKKEHQENYKSCSRSHIKAQCLKSNSYFFLVHIDDISLSEAVEQSSSLVSADNAMSSFLSSYNANLEKIQKKTRTLKLKQTAEELSAFQDQTKYLSFLNHRNLLDLSKTVLSVDKEAESELYLFTVAFDQLISSAMIRVKSLSRQHLYILNSFQLEKTSLKRFKLVQNVSTLTRYKN